MDGPDLPARHPRRVLVMRCLRGLGDLLCTVPALRALRSALPGARIDLLGLGSSASFAERFDAYVDELVEFTGFPGIPESPPDVHRLPGFLARVHARRYDAVLQMHGNGRVSNILAVALGAPVTAGFYEPGAYLPDERWFLPYPEGIHEARRLLVLTSFLGVPPAGEHLELPLTPEERDDAGRMLDEAGVSGEYAVIHPGAQNVRRRWSTEAFAQAADRLADRGLHVVLTGTPAEAHVTRHAAALMRASVADLAGRTGLGQFGALVRGARVLLTNDTGASHVAAALRVPSVVVFTGESEPERWRPPDHALHRAILPPASVEEVVRVSEELLSKEVPGVPSGVA